jgi:hypothetical protein
MVSRLLQQPLLLQLVAGEPCHRCWMGQSISVGRTANCHICQSCHVFMFTCILYTQITRSSSSFHVTVLHSESGSLMN